jgi:glycosyltransferase involved in cell wall biosynthesis
MSTSETLPLLKEGTRLRILFLPTWYPDDEDPVRGIFIREHARAAALYNEVRVLYVTAGRVGDGASSVSDTVEDGIRVRRVRYRTWCSTNALEARLSEMAARFSKRPGRGASTLGKLLALVNLFIRGTWSLAYSLNTMRECFKLMREGWRPDVIHAHVYGAGLPAVLTGAARSVPVVVSEHLGDLAHGRLNAFEAFKAGVVARRADAMLPVSDVLGEALRRLGASRVEVVPNVVEPRNAPRASSESGSKRTELIAVTSLGPTNGLDILFEAVGLVAGVRNDFRLMVVGVQLDDLGEAASEARRLQREGVVRFLGKLDKEDVLELLCRSDFLVHPTLSEAFGIVVYEAILCGKPVVTTDIEAFQEVRRAGAGILVPPGDARAFADAILRMLDTYRDYDVSGLAGEITGRCSYEAVGRSLDGIYRGVVRGPRAA